MLIRSETEYKAAVAEMTALNVTDEGGEARLEELVEAVEAWMCATGSAECGTGVKVGDKVQMAFPFPDKTGSSGFYEITRIVPPAIDGEPQYRVTGEDGRERVIGGNQIRPFITQPAKVGMPVYTPPSSS